MFSGFKLNFLKKLINFSFIPNNSGGVSKFYVPSQETIDSSNAMRLARKLGLESFDELMQFSVENSRAFFAAAFTDMGLVTKNNFQITAQNIATTADNRAPVWMPGAKVNIADTHLRWARTAPDAIAIVNKREDTGETKSYTYAELYRLSNRVASGVVEQGFKPGDSVAMCMPNSVEALAIYYGLQKAGINVVQIGYSLSNEQLDVRLADLGKYKVKAIFTQDVEINGDKPRNIIERISSLSTDAQIFAVTKGNVNIPANVKLYNDIIASGSDKFESVGRNVNDVTDIIFSSATSSTDPKKSPKAICWNSSSHFKAMMDFHYTFDVKQGEKGWAHTHPGWMVWPSSMNGFLANGGTMHIYEGSFYCQNMMDFISKEGIGSIITIPGFTDHLLKQFNSGADISSVKKLISTSGSPNHENYEELGSKTNIAIMQWVGGTELVTYKGSYYIKPVHPCKFNGDTLGTQLHYDEAGQVFIVLAKDNDAKRVPPPGLSQQLANADNNKQYYPEGLILPNGDRLRVHGDTYKKEPDGNYVYTGRADDQKNYEGNKFTILQVQGWLSERQNPKVEGYVATSVKDKTGRNDLIVVYYLPKEGEEVDRTAYYTQCREAVKKGLTLITNSVLDVVQVPPALADEMRLQLRTQKLKTNLWAKHYTEQVNPNLEPQFGKGAKAVG
jgi:acetyl-CoA synthetase